jgi:hypothetical protein
VENYVDEMIELLSLLKQRGMYGEIVDGECPRIIGGLSVAIMKFTGMPIYGHSFSISREPKGWQVSTDDKGQLVKDTFVNSMEEVVEVVESMRAV